MTYTAVIIKEGEKVKLGGEVYNEEEEEVIMRMRRSL